jgi:uncharacterized UBP type Zn finger protein
MPRAGGGSEDDKTRQLTDMGFTREKAVAALRLKGGNVEAALEHLFASG